MAVRTRPPSAALISSEDGSCAGIDAQPSALVATCFAALRPGVRNPSMVAKTRLSSAALTLLCEWQLHDKSSSVFVESKSGLMRRHSSRKTATA